MLCFEEFSNNLLTVLHEYLVLASLQNVPIGFFCHDSVNVYRKSMPGHLQRIEMKEFDENRVSEVESGAVFSQTRKHASLVWHRKNCGKRCVGVHQCS
jgi:hypothetical protein